MSHVWRQDGRQRDASIVAQTERAIAALLPTGECSLESVAAMMGMSPRRLNRQLLDMDITTLSMNLGFAELAVFSRAFRQWTGFSPKAWRRGNITE